MPVAFTLSASFALSRQRHGTKATPLPVICDLCDVDDIQDEQHVLFHRVNPHVISLRRKYASLFPPTGAHEVSFS
jgi:hypothetical protein